MQPSACIKAVCISTWVSAGNLCGERKGLKPEGQGGAKLLLLRARSAAAAQPCTLAHRHGQRWQSSHPPTFGPWQRSPPGQWAMMHRAVAPAASAVCPRCGCTGTRSSAHACRILLHPCGCCRCHQSCYHYCQIGPRRCCCCCCCCYCFGERTPQPAECCLTAIGHTRPRSHASAAAGVGSDRSQTPPLRYLDLPVRRLAFVGSVKSVQLDGASEQSSATTPALNGTSTYTGTHTHL